MIKTFMLIVILVFCVYVYEAKDLTVGTRVDNLLISTEKVKYNGIPFIQRDKDYTYTDTKQRIIKGIIARDLDNSGATVEVTSGGVGQTSVTLHLKSERGSGLNYLMLIFSNKVK